MATGAAATAAQADTTAVSTNNSGILNGTQVIAPIQAPINLCGIAAGVVGHATAGCIGGSAASLEGVFDTTLYSANNHGILNGAQVFAPIQAPINVCGVAVSVIGGSSALCRGGASADLSGGGNHRDRDRGHGNNCGCDDDGYGRESTEALPTLGGGSGLPVLGGLLGNLLGGGQAGGVDIDALDSVRAIAPERVTESDEGGWTPAPTRPSPAPSTPAPSTGGGGQHHDDDECDDDHGRHRPAHRADDRDVTLVSRNNSGIGNGTQIYAPIQVPINISGVAVGVLGDATAWSLGGAVAR